ncbi:MAG: hypothetical protein GX444_03965 [Myxococcales bacterium]|nr:hypothetical protein [Myxococcales bacterium]
MGRSIKKRKEAMWGFMPADLKYAQAVCEELSHHLEAVAFVLNVRAKMKCLADCDRDLSWGYGDGPLRMRHELIDRARFHAIRLGLVEITEGSTFYDGKGRKTKYRLSFKWKVYDPEKPGLFLLHSPFVHGKWKACFTAEGKWAPGVSPRVAPYESRKNKILVRTPNNNTSDMRTDAVFSENGKNSVSPTVGRTEPPSVVRTADEFNKLPSIEGRRNGPMAKREFRKP